jgi:hypothetical protein
MLYVVTSRKGQDEIFRDCSKNRAERPQKGYIAEENKEKKRNTFLTLKL